MGKRRLNKKKVFFVLFLFIGMGVGIYYWLTQEHEKSNRFETQLINIKKDGVSSIVINNKIDGFQDVTLRKDGDHWLLSKGSFTTIANKNVVERFLNRFEKVESNYIAARNEANWEEYQVDKAQGHWYRFYNNQELIDEFILSGKKSLKFFIDSKMM